MKMCPNCKNEYADSVAICPADGTILDLDIPETVSEPETTATHLDAVPHVAETVDRIGTAAAETFERDAWSSGTIGDRVSTVDFSQTDELIDDDYAENPFYSWLAPLIIIILLIILGYWVCG